MSGKRWQIGAAAAVGVLLTAGLSRAFQMTAGEALRMAAIAGGAAAAAGLAGGLALMAGRRLSIGAQAVIAAVTPVVAVGAGAMVAADSMFLTSHDLDALVVIVAASATVGVVVAMLLGARVAAATRSIAAAARRIGDGDLSVEVERPDTSEFGALARELEAMSHRLGEGRARERALDDSRRELVAWISHDLRTPLAAIRAVTEALEDGVVEDPGTVARYHRTLRAETDRLAGLVDDLFELSRINAGALRLELNRVALSDVVSDALAAASTVALAKGVRLEGVMDGSPEVPVATHELSRALRNVLENAIRHTPGDGSVSVHAGIEGDLAYVSVADGCGGIPEDDLDRVFDLAFRGEAARTPGPDTGAGLGLAIARGIVEAHHGDISVRNEGPGCRFTLRLPLDRPA